MSNIDDLFGEDEDGFCNIIADEPPRNLPVQVAPNPATHPFLFGTKKKKTKKHSTDNETNKKKHKKKKTKTPHDDSAPAPSIPMPPAANTTSMGPPKAPATKVGSAAAPRLKRNSKSTAEDGGEAEPKNSDDIWALAAQDDMESDLTANSEDLRFIADEDEEDEDDFSETPARRKDPYLGSGDDDSEVRRKRRGRPRGSKNKKNRIESPDGSSSSGLDMANEAAEINTQRNDGANMVQQQLAVSTPRPINHSALVSKEESIKRWTSGLDVKEIPPRIYHGALPSLLYKNGGTSVYDKYRDQIEQVMREYQENSDEDEDENDPSKLANMVLRKRRQLELLPISTEQDLAEGMTLCKLCGWIKADSEKRNALSSARLSKDEDMKAVQANSTGLDQYAYSNFVDFMVAGLALNNPEDLSALGESFFYNRIWRFNPMLTQVRREDIYYHFFGKPCVIDPRFVSAMMIRENIEYKTEIRRTAVIKNALSGDEIVDDKLARAYVGVVKNLKELYTWDCKKMNFFCNDFKVTNMLVAPAACVVQTTKKQTYRSIQK
jgi:hypothetical protein